MPIKCHSPVNLQEKPQAVIFDLDHTLYDYTQAHQAGKTALVAQLVEDYQLCPKEAQRLYASSREQVHAQLGATASSHSRLLYCQTLFEHMGLQSQPMRALALEQTYWRAFFEQMRLFPGVQTMLDYLRMQQIQVCLVTDLTARIQFRKLLYLDIHESFDWIVTSEEAGGDKSTKKPFECLAHKLRLPDGARVWLIGDAPCDSAPAMPAFPNALCFLRGAKPFPGVQVTFEKFSDLLACLQQQPQEEALLT